MPRTRTEGCVLQYFWVPAIRALSVLMRLVMVWLLTPLLILYRPMQEVTERERADAACEVCPSRSLRGRQKCKLGRSPQLFFSEEADCS